MRVKIVSTGSYLPEKIVTNQDLANRGIPINPDWVKENLGIEERRIVEPGVRCSDLAARAAEKALKRIGMNAQEIDLIIVATSTPDRLSPSTACIVQKKIGAYNAVAYDLNAVCSGFIFAMVFAADCIEMGHYKNVLVIGADVFSTITDWSSKTCTFFGDGAGAVILRKGLSPRILSSVLGSDGEGMDFFTTPHFGTFSIQAKQLYDFGCRVLPPAVQQVLNKVYWKADEIAHIIPHQASKKMLIKLCELSGAPVEKLRTNMKTVGNTAAGTVPILLDELNDQGLLKEWDKILFMVMGSGMTWGVCAYEW